MLAIVVVLSIVAAGLITWLLWIYFGGRRIRNLVRGWFSGILLGTERVRARICLPPAARIEKGVCNLTRTPLPQRKWLISTKAGPGDILQFCLRWRNMGNTSIPAGEVRLADELSGPVDLIPGSGIANIENGEGVPLSDELVQQLLGKGLSLPSIPGAPAELEELLGLYIRYQVRVRFDGGANGGFQEGPLPEGAHAPQAPAPQAAPPPQEE